MFVVCCAWCWCLENLMRSIGPSSKGRPISHEAAGLHHVSSAPSTTGNLASLRRRMPKEEAAAWTYPFDKCLSVPRHRYQFPAISSKLNTAAQSITTSQKCCADTISTLFTFATMSWFSRLLATVLPFQQSTLQPPPGIPLPSYHDHSIHQRGAVASESRECSQIGVDILKIGGNAADAMVGTTICVGVIGMYHSGIGGGGFALVRLANGSYQSIDFRETAPAAAFQDMYKHDVNASIYGGLSA